MHYYDPWFSNDLYYEPPTYYRIPPPPPPTYYNRHPFYSNNPPPYLPPPPPIPRRNLSLFSSVMYDTTNRGGIGDWSAGAGGGGGVNEEFRQRGNTIYVVRKRLRQKGKLIKKRYKAGLSCVGPPGNMQQGSVNSYSSRHTKDDDDEEEEYEDSEYEEDEDDEEEEYMGPWTPYGTVDSSGGIHKLPTTSTN